MGMLSHECSTTFGGRGVGGCDFIDLWVIYDYAISHLRSTLLIILLLYSSIVYTQTGTHDMLPR